jgi:hypothetical protein
MGVLHTAIMNLQMVAEHDNCKGKFISHRVGKVRQYILQMIEQGHTSQYDRKALHAMCAHVHYLENTVDKASTENFNLIGGIRGMMILDSKQMRSAVYDAQMLRNTDDDKLLSMNDIQAMALLNAQELRTDL